jgi:hypothetical protein
MKMIASKSTDWKLFFLLLIPLESHKKATNGELNGTKTVPVLIS